MFRFTTSENAELHTAVMQVLWDANEQLETALTIDDVLARLPAAGWLGELGDEQVGGALTQLARWGLLDATQNHAAHYASAAEYERKNLLYALTRKGEAALEGISHALTRLGESGALQTAVLAAIADRLDDLYRLLTGDTWDDQVVFARLMELEAHLDALRTGTRQFNSDLQRLLRDDAADLATFHEVKAKTVAYLEEYVTDLDQRRQRIADAVARVESLGVGVLHRRALAGANLHSVRGADPAPAWLAQREARWEGLRRWFRPLDGEPARIDELREVAQRAIISLLRVLELLRESRRRQSSIAADFRTLARWFAAAPSEADAHRLFNAAFGLWPARHAHLAADDPEGTPASTPWGEAPPVPVSPLLRTHGRSEKFGATARLRDTTELRRRRQAEAARQRAELEAAWRQLATNGAVRLSSFGALDHSTFERLLELLGRALAVPAGTDGNRRATTADGQLEIVLSRVDDGRRAVLTTPRGRFGGPDLLVEIRSPFEAGTAAARDLAAAAR
jgi:uncharacterized protein (TIGR02677 family)